MLSMKAYFDVLWDLFEPDLQNLPSQLDLLRKKLYMVPPYVFTYDLVIETF